VITGQRVQLASVAATILLLSYYAAANCFSEPQRVASPLIPDQSIRLGLDLQGGIHWVLGVQLDAAIQHELEYLRSALVEALAEDDVKLASVEASDGRLRIRAEPGAESEKVRAWVGERDVLVAAPGSDGELVYSLSETWQREVRERGMAQVLEVLRRRIEDPIQGIPDSVVTRQGADRILVQIPGGQIDRTRARDLLKVTGFLEFKIVRESAQTEELLRAKHPNGLPADAEIAFERDKETQRILSAYLVGTAADLTGDYLEDARVNFDNRQRPIVGFQFNAQGGEIFQKLTEQHIGDQLAIVLDDRVYSAPVIRARIGSRGQIEGRFSPQEAADLAVVLRSGSLSLPVTIEEERTIGPALGADSIRHGIQASVASLIAVLVFAVVYYRLSGGYATIAITVGMIMIIGLMTMFRATLTMPGIAGLVLTVGMAIDGNVMIFERIREELRHGKTPRAAIRAGFSRALPPILDGHITTMITALVLYQYGTGPIKGFAVTLGLGLIATVFQAVVVNRMLFAIYPGDRPVADLSI
jgi:preprotein translocase subunit SecD